LNVRRVSNHRPLVSRYLRRPAAPTRFTANDRKRSALKAALNSARADLVEVVVDAEERPTKPEELKA
jgi:hypothetical protein